MTSETAAIGARRVQRPSWRDPRLGIGVVLVAGSVALGVWAFAGTGTGMAVYAAREVLTPGESLDGAELAVVEVRVPGGDGVYLSADEPVPADGVVTRLVGRGELVPVAAVGSAAEIGARPVSVAISGPVSTSVVEGALVDLWLTRSPSGLGGSAGPAEPALVAAALRVAGLRTDDSLFAGVGATSVEVLVPEPELPAVLAALVEEGEITLVPLPGGA
jgi:hypothetical protein